MVQQSRCLFAILAFVCLAAPAAAGVTPAFGPEAYALTSGEAELFQDSFESEAEGRFVLYVRNGDGESARVTSAEVDLNGSAVVLGGELDEATRGLMRPVELVVGTNELTLSLQGAPGSFVTVVIAPPGAPPVFVSGRLLLPWGRIDEEHGLALALRNDSQRAPRLLRVLFFGPGGDVVAASDKMPLPPRGSIAFPVEDAMDMGQWSVGSIEVIYTGPGPGRLFGTARQGFPSPVPHSDTQPLVQAGFGIVDAPPHPPAHRR